MEDTTTLTLLVVITPISYEVILSGAIIIRVYFTPNWSLIGFSKNPDPAYYGVRT